MKDKLPDIREYLTEQSIIAYRKSIIEECAQVAELYRWSEPFMGIQDTIITAIRALKDKP